AYLGSDQSRWRDYDASLLLTGSEATFPILVDQGEADNFLEEQLHPKALSEAAQQSTHPFESRTQPGYDHSYYFIASFIDDHLRFHAEALQN
ncbi:MAG: alpha/beta hydrolase-fold protein, partial [Saccharospirillum sp.]